MIWMLAWRNIWRNKKRAAITMASVFFAVVLSTIMYAMLDGVYTQMVDNVAAFSTGYIQIHEKGYWQDRSLELAMEPDSALMKSIQTVKDASMPVPRIETFALASTGNKTAGVVLMGIDPEGENKSTHLSRRLCAGNYLQPSDKSLMAGKRLAQKLGAVPGDTIIIISQGYQAASANGRYPLKGILALGSPELDQSMLYLPLAEAQQLLSLDQQITGLTLMLKPGTNATAVKKWLEVQTDSSTYEVLDWKEMMPQVDQMIEADGAGHRITLMVLYIVISFGVFNTVMMMMAERKREFGIMVAIGMKKSRLSLLVAIETLMLTGLGIISGIGAAWPLLQYLSLHPIQVTGELKAMYESYGFEAVIPVSTRFHVFWSQIKTVGFIACVVMIYPVIKMSRLRLQHALTA